MPDAGQNTSVSSLLYYASVLVHRVAPRAGLARLGARWGFWCPGQGIELWEFSLPDGPGGLAAALEARTDIHIRRRSGLADLRHTVETTPVICAVDSFHLPYRPAYGRVHSHRTVLLEQGRSDRVWVIDDWPPGYRGWLSWDTLRNACECEVPLDPEREPVFAGGCLHCDWWTVTAPPLAPTDVRTWSWGLLQAVCDDHAGITPGTVPVAEALDRFAGDVRGGIPADRRRQALRY